MSVALDGEAYDCLIALATPIPPERRQAFFDAVLSALERHAEPGPGLVNRIARSLQGDFYRPDTAAGPAIAKPGTRARVGKYAR
jgi:hypothetical protein